VVELTMVYGRHNELVHVGFFMVLPILQDLMGFNGIYKKNNGDFIVIQWDINGIFPLVFFNVAIENGS
jgi:hypothetical protein